MKRNSQNSSLLIAIAAVTLLAACGDNRTAEEIVTERAQARLDAFVAQDFETARKYYTPGFRERVSLDAYLRSQADQPFRWTDAEISSVVCEQERCRVKVVVSFEIPSAPNQLSGFRSRQGIDEIWLFIDGKWWYSSN